MERAAFCSDEHHDYHALSARGRGRGIISGDAIATNTGGTSFDLVVTNLSFIAENSPTGSTYIKLEILQNFAIFSPGGTYTGTHGVDGSWSTGASNFIQGDAIHDFGGSNVLLPTLLYYNTFMIPTFAVSPTSASVTNTIGVYSIKAELQMNIEGDGFISLPNSYDGSATLVPEPAVSSLLCLAGLVALRRRSRRPGP